MIEITVFLPQIDIEIDTLLNIDCNNEEIY